MEVVSVVHEQHGEPSTVAMATSATAVEPSVTLARLVTERPGLARELERLELDYCCGGRRSLAEACAARGLDADEVARALTAVATADPAIWDGATATGLVDHIEATHHAYLWAELPRLGALVDKVVGAHGARHPELTQVQATYAALQADLEPHLRKEELILFPMIRELDAAGARGDAEAPAFHCGTLRNPISVMLVEHERAGELLAELRATTDAHTPPDDACGSYRALYHGLAELEADTHMHIHTENNVLFPLVLGLEHQLHDRARSTTPTP